MSVVATCKFHCGVFEFYDYGSITCFLRDSGVWCTTGGWRSEYQGLGARPVVDSGVAAVEEVVGSSRCCDESGVNCLDAFSDETRRIEIPRVSSWDHGGVGSVGACDCSGLGKIAEKESSVKVEDAGLNIRGPNYERNKKNREEQKARKVKQRLMQQDWRDCGTGQVATKVLGCAVIVPSGEGKSTLARRYPDLFLDHDSCLDVAMLRSLKEPVGGVTDWNKVNGYLRSVVPASPKVLLTWSRDTVPESCCVLAEVMLENPTGLRENSENRTVLVSPKVCSDYVARDQYIAEVLRANGYSVGSLGKQEQDVCQEKVVVTPEGAWRNVVGRGPNWERNQCWRKEKQRKKDARSISRLEAMTKVQGAERVISERGGYFSKCPQDVQEELRRTRAEYLIAKNQRDTLEEKRKLKEMNSSVQLIADTLKLMKMSEQVTKRSVASKIGGWAKTLVSGASESFVASAAERSDSVPSLESVRESESVSRVGESVIEARRVAYQLALDAVESEYESYESFNDVDYEADILAVKKKFSDVAYTAEEAVRRGSMIELATRLCGMGISMEKINEALVELKIIENDFCY